MRTTSLHAPCLGPSAARSRAVIGATLALTAILSACPVALAQSGGPLPIVEPSGNAKPEYSKERSPSAAQLIETWRSSNQNLVNKRLDTERFEIVAQKVAPGRVSRAFLQFRILGANGDAAAWAAARCPGRSRPLELQVYFEWSDYLHAWVPIYTRGEGNEDLCGAGALWSAEQIEKLVNPAPLPAPPKVSRADVRTPPPGSPERAALMDALRPRYEALFGPPIQFKVETLRVAAGFAFVVVHPQRPSGAPIERGVWARALGSPCFQNPAGVNHEYWMQKVDGAWKIGVANKMCADDSISSEGDLIGAPPQLAGQDAWPVRDTMPEPE